MRGRLVEADGRPFSICMFCILLQVTVYKCDSSICHAGCTVKNVSAELDLCREVEYVLTGCSVSPGEP